MSSQQDLIRIKIERVSSPTTFFEECVKYAIHTEKEIQIEVTAALSRKDRRALRRWYALGLMERILFLTHTFKVNIYNENQVTDILKSYSIPEWDICIDGKILFFFDFNRQLFYIEIQEQRLSIMKEWLDHLSGSNVICGVGIGEGRRNSILVS